METLARDIHIEYKNNRHLNTNNCKVLQILIFFTNEKKEFLSRGARECSLLAWTLERELVCVGGPWPAWRSEAPFLTFSTQQGAPSGTLALGRGGCGGPENKALLSSNQPLAWGCQDFAPLCYKSNFQKLKDM